MKCAVEDYIMWMGNTIKREFYLVGNIDYIYFLGTICETTG
jgi:hypothetical protein